MVVTYYLWPEERKIDRNGQGVDDSHTKVNADRCIRVIVRCQPRGHDVSRVKRVMKRTNLRSMCHAQGTLPEIRCTAIVGRFRGDNGAFPLLC